MTRRLKYRHANRQHTLGTKQHERRRLDIVSFHAVGLNRCRLTSRGSVLANQETTL